VLLGARKACPGLDGYPAVIAHFWPHSWVVSVVVLLDCFGALVVFVDFCADAALSTASAVGLRGIPTALVKAGICLLAAPLSLPRSITRAAALSPLCLGALGYICALVVSRAFSAEAFRDQEEPRLELFSLSSSSLRGMCAILFAFVSQMNLFSVMASLRDPTPERKRLVALLANLLMLSTYAVVAVSGYIAFGRGVHADVLTNFDPERTEVKLASVAMVGMLVVCFVLLVYPVREAVLDLWGAHEAGTAAWLAATLLTAAAVAAVSMAFPSVVSALDVLGGFCAPCIIFVFPALTLRVSEAPLRACALYAGALVGFVALAQALLEAAGLTI